MDYSSLYKSIELILPELAVSISLVVLVIADLIWDKNKKYIPFIALLGLFITILYVIGQFGTEGFAFIYSENNPNNYGILAIDNFGGFFKLIVIVSSILIVYFSLRSDEIQKTIDRSGEYFALIFGMIVGMMVMISAVDLIVIYLALELLSLSSYVLAGFTKLRDRNAEASLKYLIFGAVSSGIMLFGISILYGLTGSTNLYVINDVIRSTNLNVLLVSFSSILIFAGVGYKISAAPFHFWTPDVYEGAPISITAYLSVASKAAGFALLVRLVRTGFVNYADEFGNWELMPAFDWQLLLIVVSVLTMTLGNFAALWQDNLKRMLAYSSIAHAGYLMLGLVVLSDQGVLAILIYFVFYLLMNLGAFYIVMIIANKTGSEEIDDYNGLGSKFPFFGVALTIFLISLTGLPPTAGFIGKLYIFMALIDAKMIAVAVIAILNSVVSLYYYIRVLKHMYLVKAPENLGADTSSLSDKIFVGILLVPILFFGVYFSPVINFAKSCINLLGF
ncbi:MAG: NADH-quinone oxidoreductase subunit N [Melioribacteraceae bacterium]|nr:NADH-quinone oxidoreductase subunit N [Melioribacteraceae bacterium]